MRPGKCFIGGYFGLVEFGEEISFETADSNLSRIDLQLFKTSLF